MRVSRDGTLAMLIITAALGALIWMALLVGLSHAATPPKNPGWQGASITGCTVDNPHQYPETKDYTPGHATFMRGIIKVYAGKMNYGTIEAWADDYPDVTYTCYYLDNKQPFPSAAHGWVWVNWGDDAQYKDYTIYPVTFTPYYDPSGSGTTTIGSGNVLPPCNGRLNYAQQQAFNNHACFQESLNQQQGGWTFYEDWSGECFANFGAYQHNTVGQNCGQHFGCYSVLICPDGNWTCGNSCNTI